MNKTKERKGKTNLIKLIQFIIILFIMFGEYKLKAIF